MLRIAFIGVRISWLMLARNIDLVSVASSALTLASFSAFSCSLRSVTSRIDTATCAPVGAAGRQRTESDLDRKLRAIFAKPAKLPAGAHFTSRRRLMKLLPQCGMSRLHVPRDEHFHGLANELVARITEQRFAPRVCQSNHTGRVDHHQAVRSEFEHAAEELLGFTKALALRGQLGLLSKQPQVALQHLEAHCRRAASGRRGELFPAN